MITLTPRISSHKHDSVYIFLLDSKKNFSEKKKKKTIPCHPNTPLFQQHETKNLQPEENLLDITTRTLHRSRPLPTMGNELPIFGRDLRSTMEIDLGETEIDKLL